MSPYTPHQTSFSRRKNHYIMNMVRSILKGANLSKGFWREVVSTTTYLLDRCHTKNFEKITPEESWYGFKSNMSHLRVFILVAYQHVSDQHRKKLDGKGEHMILVGYWLVVFVPSLLVVLPYYFIVFCSIRFRLSYFFLWWHIFFVFRI